MKSDLLPPDKAAAYIHAVIEASRTIYTEDVVGKLHQAGLAEAIEHWRDENGVPLPAQFLLESGRLVAQKISSSASGWPACCRPMPGMGP